MPRTVPLAGARFDLDVEAVVRSLNDRTRALLLSHPANPTGRCYPADVLAALGEGLKNAEDELKSCITLIVDKRIVILRVPYGSPVPRLYHRTVLIYSFGKYHFMQGQRLGYAAVSPYHPERATVAEELVRWARITGIATPTALMQRALPRLLALQYDLDWLDHCRARLLMELTRDCYMVSEPDARPV